MGKQKVQDSRRVCIAELAIVLFVAFAAPLLVSVLAPFSIVPRRSEESLSVAVYFALIHAFAAIAVLVYVLFRQGRSVRDIGLTARWLDIPTSILLALAAFSAELCVLVLLRYGHFIFTGYTLPQGPHITTYLGAGITVGTVLFVLVNPFFEELIVRAYAMTEVETLTKSAVAAVAVSVVVQALYHVYQGVPAALCHAGAFLVLSLYYLKTRRALPVILAHLYFDVLALVFGGGR